VKKILFLFVTIIAFFQPYVWAQNNSKVPENVYLVELELNLMRVNQGINSVIQGPRPDISDIEVKIGFPSKDLFGNPVIEQRKIFDDELKRSTTSRWFLISVPATENAASIMINRQPHRLSLTEAYRYQVGRVEVVTKPFPVNNLLELTRESFELNERYSVNYLNPDSRFGGNSPCVSVPIKRGRRNSQDIAICDTKTKSKYISVLDKQGFLTSVRKISEFDDLEDGDFAPSMFTRVTRAPSPPKDVKYKGQHADPTNFKLAGIVFGWNGEKIKFDQIGLYVPEGLSPKDVAILSQPSAGDVELFWNEDLSSYEIKFSEPDLFVEYNGDLYSFGSEKMNVSALSKEFDNGKALVKALNEWSEDPSKAFSYQFPFAKKVPIKAESRGKNRIVLSLDSIPWIKTEFSVLAPDYLRDDERLSLEGWLLKVGKDINSSTIGKLDATNKIGSSKIINRLNKLNQGTVYLHPPRNGRLALLLPLEFKLNEKSLKEKSVYTLSDKRAASKKVTLRANSIRGLAPIMQIEQVDNSRITIFDQVDKLGLKGQRITHEDRNGKVTKIKKLDLELYKVKSITPQGINTYTNTLISKSNAREFAKGLEDLSAMQDGDSQIKSIVSIWSRILTPSFSGVDVYVADNTAQPIYRTRDIDIATLPHSIVSSHYRTMPGRLSSQIEVWSGRWLKASDAQNHFVYDAKSAQTQYVLFDIEDIYNYTSTDSSSEDDGADFLDESMDDAGPVYTPYEKFEYQWGRLNDALFKQVNLNSGKNIRAFVAFANNGQIQFKELASFRLSDKRKFSGLAKDLINVSGNFGSYNSVSESLDSKLKLFVNTIIDDFQPNSVLYYVKPGGEKPRYRKISTIENLFETHLLSGVLDAEPSFNFASIINNKGQK
jgi:hypothetical protein